MVLKHVEMLGFCDNVQGTFSLLCLGISAKVARGSCLVSKVLEKISQMDDNALARLLGNAQNMLLKKPENADASLVINAVQEEWDRRLRLFRNGDYKATTPEQGVLSVVGYKVGNGGDSEKIRRLKLDYIMSGSLPPVASPAYMAEWGAPSTRQRYRKLHRVIRVLASSGKAFPNMELAVQHWEEDLGYLEKAWRNVNEP